MERHDDIEDDPVVNSLHGDGDGCQKRPHGLLLFSADLGDHLQLPFRPARHNARHGGGLNALHTAGVGDDDALHIFDDVVADADLDPVRLLAQHLPGPGGGVGDGDGLGAAHRGDQFFLHDLYVGLIDGTVLFHGIHSPFAGRFSARISTMVFSVAVMPGEAIRPILHMVSSGVSALIPCIL